MNYEVAMTQLTLLYDIKQILLANTWVTAGSLILAFVALIISYIALRIASKNGKG